MSFTATGIQLTWQGAVTAGAVSGGLSGGIKGAIVGGISGAVTAGIGGLDLGLTGFANAAVKAGLHGLAQGALAEAQGGRFATAFLATALSQLGSVGINSAIGGTGPGAFAARLVATAVIGGVSSVVGGGKFQNGAATAAFVYLLSQAGGGAGGAGGPTESQGTGGTAFVGGFFDYWAKGPAYQEYVLEAAAGKDVAYFTWDQGRALGAWIDANGGNVAVVGHSYGGDTAASVVAAGHRVASLTTVDPVSWFRPNLAAVAANAGTWTNLNATGGQGSWVNIVAGIGGAWNNAPAPYATSHWSIGGRNHANIMQCWAAPRAC